MSQTTVVWQPVHILAHVKKHCCLESYTGQGEQTEPLQNDKKKMTQVVSIMRLLIKTDKMICRQFYHTQTITASSNQKLKVEP